METTTLHAGLTPKGNVLCWFKKKGLGAPDWQSFVDGFERLVAEACDAHDSPAGRPEGTKAMSRGAAVLLTAPVFRVVLRGLKRDEAIAAGLAREDFRIDLATAVVRTLSELRRARRDGRVGDRSSKRPLPPSETESPYVEEMGEPR